MSVPQHDVARTFATDQLYRTIRTLIRSATVATIFYWGFQCLQVLAGQDTKLSIAVSLVFSALADIKFAAALTMAGSTTAWAIMERTLRHRKVDSMQGRIRQLEQMIDPNRTSSGLTTQGKTHPRDRLR
jgi:hypothetical protein